MNAELFKKIAPKAFYGKYLEKDIRPDGRDMDEGRDIIIADAHITSADGSCFVRYGSTAIICGLTLELLNQKEVNVNSGFIDVDVILSPLSNSKVLLGKTSTQARYYAKTLKELFEKYVIDLGELFVLDVKKLLMLHIDLVIVDYEGSVFDACCLAFLCSLYTLRIPSYSMKDDEIVCNYDSYRKLSIREIPISITFGLFDDFEVLDPDVFEEDLIEDSVTILLGTNNKILSVLKSGGKAITESILTTLRDKARDRYNDIYSKIEEFKSSLSM